jgi:nucleoside 2-deoxyribosyltransferase
MHKSVYLAGPITGLSWNGATDWRDAVQHELRKHGIKGVSPLRYKHYLQGEASLQHTYDVHPMSTARGIMTRDHMDCMRCDAILANFLDTEKVSIGTVMECAWAYAYRKPLIIVREDVNLHKHPMMDEAAGYVVPNLEDAVELLIGLFSEY